MRICIVVNNLSPSVGWGRLALKAAAGFKLRGHEVGFIIEQEPLNLEAEHLVVSLKLPSFKNPLDFLFRLKAIRNFIGPYDVVLCYDVNPNAIILNMANWNQRRKIIIHALATYSLLGAGTPIRNFLMRWAYRRAKKVLVVSEFTKRQIEKSGLKLKEYFIVPVGVDTNLFRPLPAGEILPYPFILTVGALKPRKGYHVSISAFKLIAREFPDLKYVIIGDQDMTKYYDELKGLVSSLELDDRVIFLEKVSDADLVGYYNSAELFFLTPLTEPESIEGFGMVYLEAGACGAPVIGAYDTGAEAAIVNNVNGFLVKYDPTEIAAAIKKILLDKSLAKMLGAQGIKMAGKFDWTNIAGLYLKYFNENTDITR